MGNLKYSPSSWLINLHNISEHPVKLSKGKGKGSHNFPYFTDKGDCDREVVQLSSLMSCGERQKKDPDLQKNPSVPYPLSHYFAFITFWLRVFRKHGLGFLSAELVTQMRPCLFSCLCICLCPVSLPLRGSLRPIYPKRDEARMSQTHGKLKMIYNQGSQTHIFHRNYGLMMWVFFNGQNRSLCNLKYEMGKGYNKVYWIHPNLAHFIESLHMLLKLCWFKGKQRVTLGIILWWKKTRA